MEIGTLKLKNRFLLAPMLEPNDIVFRLLCKKAGCGLTYTGMVNPLSRQKIYFDDSPTVQLFCNSTRGLKEFVKKYDSFVSLWDFNLGCPSKLAGKLKVGSFMHSNLEMIENILKTIRENTKKPVTIKLRKSKNVFKILKIAEKYCDAVAIHPRTRRQGYSGEADYSYALKLKKKTKLPVIYSGDVSEKNVGKVLKDFDFVMVGREAIGNPCIFSKLLGRKCNLGFKDYLKLAKKYKLYFRQIKYQVMNFTRFMKHATHLRRELSFCKTVKEIEEVMKNKKE